jgi:hypothetical protein
MQRLNSIRRINHFSDARSEGQRWTGKQIAAETSFGQPARMGLCARPSQLGSAIGGHHADRYYAVSR